MRHSWLDDLVKSGSISSEARDEILADGREMAKIAANVNSQAYKDMVAKLTPYTNAAAGLLATGGFLLWPKMRDASEIRKTIADIGQNKDEMLAHPDFQDHKDIAAARFDEITQLAPSAARSKPFMMKMVKSRLHSGLSEQDVVSLAGIQATYTPKAGMQKKLQQKVASARMGEACADVYLMAKTAGIDTLGAAASAAAAVKSDKGALAKKMLGMLGLGLTLAIPSLAISVGTGGINQLLSSKDARNLAQRQREAFEAAIEMSHPEKEPLRANRERAAQAFKTLTHFAPHVAADPQAARSFMTRIVSFDTGVEPSLVKDLTDIERNMGGSAQKISPFLAGMGAGAKYTGLEKSVSKTTESILSPVHDTLSYNVHQAIDANI